MPRNIFLNISIPCPITNRSIFLNIILISVFQVKTSPSRLFSFPPQNSCSCWVEHGEVYSDIFAAESLVHSAKTYEVLAAQRHKTSFSSMPSRCSSSASLFSCERARNRRCKTTRPRCLSEQTPPIPTNPSIGTTEGSLSNSIDQRFPESLSHNPLQSTVSQSTDKRLISLSGRIRRFSDYRGHRTTRSFPSIERVDLDSRHVSYIERRSNMLNRQSRKSSTDSSDSSSSLSTEPPRVLRNTTTSTSYRAGKSFSYLYYTHGY